MGRSDQNSGSGILNFNAVICSILSTFYKASFRFCGKEFICVEQAYQFSKAIFFGDFETATLLMQLSDGHMLKKAARLIKKYDEKEWRTMASGTLKEIYRSRFKFDAAGRKTLLESGNAYLAFRVRSLRWGVGVDGGPDHVPQGCSNITGFILMAVRKELQEYHQRFNKKNSDAVSSDFELEFLKSPESKIQPRLFKQETLHLADGSVRRIWVRNVASKGDGGRSVPSSSASAVRSSSRRESRGRTERRASPSRRSPSRRSPSRRSPSRRSPSQNPLPSHHRNQRQPSHSSARRSRDSKRRRT